MADISITWGTKVIYIPKSYLGDPISGTLYELDTDAFRLDLKSLEDDEEGMPFPDTHSHNTEVSVAGVTLARVIEIINGYSIEFEDDYYSVRLVGSNNNMFDIQSGILVQNKVQVIPGNSAGLISSTAIEYASFDGGVTIDVVNGVSGTLGSSTNPIGTPRNPSSNTADALLIATNRGFRTFYIVGDIDLDSGTDFDEAIFVGESKTKTVIDISDDADVENCEFYDAEVTGILDGGNVLKNCLIKNINYVNGYIEQCVLGTGTITLGGGAEAHFLDCWSGVVGTATPIIDMGGSGQGLGMRNYNGGIKLTNKSGSEKVSIDLNSGHVVLDDLVTNGEIVIRGIGKLTDGSDGAAVNADDLVNPAALASEVWEHVDGTLLMKLIKNKKALEKTGSVWELIIYDDDNSTPIMNKILKDKDGNDITDPYAGVLAQELRTSI